MHIFHKWGKWEQFSETWLRHGRISYEAVNYTQELQKKYCLKCNKVKIERVDP